jgi:hypothetical protein
MIKVTNLNFIIKFAVKGKKAEPGQEMPVVASPEVAVNHFSGHPISVVQTKQKE